jgi:hypothetical protein
VRSHRVNRRASPPRIRRAREGPAKDRAPRRARQLPRGGPCSFPRGWAWASAWRSSTAVLSSACPARARPVERLEVPGTALRPTTQSGRPRTCAPSRACGGCSTFPPGTLNPRLRARGQLGVAVHDTQAPAGRALRGRNRRGGLGSFPGFERMRAGEALLSPSARRNLGVRRCAPARVRTWCPASPPARGLRLREGGNRGVVTKPQPPGWQPRIYFTR